MLERFFALAASRLAALNAAWIAWAAAVAPRIGSAKANMRAALAAGRASALAPSETMVAAYIKGDAIRGFDLLCASLASAPVDDLESWLGLAWDASLAMLAATRFTSSTPVTARHMSAPITSAWNNTLDWEADPLMARTSSSSFNLRRAEGRMFAISTITGLSRSRRLEVKPEI